MLLHGLDAGVASLPMTTFLGKCIDRAANHTFKARNTSFLKAVLQLFRQARRRLVPRIRGDSQVSLIHAADLADLLERAGRRPEAAGRTYFAADHRSYWMREVIALMGRVLGRRVCQLPVVPAVLWPLALVNEQFLRAGRGIEALTRTRLKEFGERFWALDTRRAREELGWEPARSLEEGLRETAGWYREQGWL